MRIGIDFDNTIVCYDKVFVDAAQRRGLIPMGWNGQKVEVREFIRSLPDGELAWQGLQGWVYGAGIGSAEVFDGVIGFLEKCRQTGAEIFIVSHKTQFGHQDASYTDLRMAALSWMRKNGLVGTAQSIVASSHIYFEDTIAAKVNRISDLNLDFFIDDLVDVFMQPLFPKGVRAILFASPQIVRSGQFIALGTWADIYREVFVA